MSDADFNARLHRIQQSRAQVGEGGSRPGPGSLPGPAGNYQERLERALTHAAMAGISRDAGFPPLMRGLAAIGIPVRPLHYKSAASLFISGVLLGLLVFGGILWLVSSPQVGAPTRGAIATLVYFGWLGVWVTSAAIGVAFMVIIKAQAARASLPRWRDL